MTRVVRRQLRVALAAAAIAVCWVLVGPAAGALPARPQITAGVALTADTYTPAPPPVYGTPLPFPLQSATAYATGFSDALKLSGSTLLGEPAPASADENVTLYVVTDTLPGGTPCVKNQVGQESGPNCIVLEEAGGQLSYGGKDELPPVTGTFLAYGSVPVTATLTISQVGQSNCVLSGNAPALPGHSPFVAPMCLYTVDRSQVGSEGLATFIRQEAQVHVSDVKVNGVPLNVGTGCSSRPFELTLTGSSVGSAFPAGSAPPGEFAVTSGGTINGYADIPPFTGCTAADGENLAPLLDSSVSGPGNYVQLAQGNLCYSTNSGCPAIPPDPSQSRTAPPVVGIYSGDANNTASASASTEVCGPSGVTAKRDGPVGDTDLAIITSFSVQNCTLTSPSENGSCKITPQDLPWPVTATSYDPAGNVATGNISGMDFTGTCTITSGTQAGDGDGLPVGGSCSFELTGQVDIAYDYGSGTLADIGSPIYTNTDSTCGTPATASRSGHGLFFVPGGQNNLFIPQFVIPSSGASQ